MTNNPVFATSLAEQEAARWWFVLILDLAPEANALEVEDIVWRASTQPLTLVKSNAQIWVMFEDERPKGDTALSEMILRHEQWAGVCLGTFRLLAPGYYWEFRRRNLVAQPIGESGVAPLYVQSLVLNKDRAPVEEGVPQQVYEYMNAAERDRGVYRALLSLFRAANVVEEAPIFHFRAVEAAARSAAGSTEKVTSPQTWHTGLEKLGLGYTKANRELLSRAHEWRHGDVTTTVTADRSYWLALGELSMKAVVRLARLRNDKVTSPESYLT